VAPWGGAGVRSRAWPWSAGLALTGVLAERDFFDDFRLYRPHMLLGVGPPLLTLFALACSRRIAPLLGRAAPGLPVAAQTFRIAVEIVLWRLAVAGAARSW